MRSLFVRYDADSDVLYISKGAGQRERPVWTLELKEGVFIRKDVEDGRIAGLIVLDYETYFRNLDDLSWLKDSPLPPHLVSFICSRPTFRAAV